MLEDVRRHAFRQVDEAVIVADVDAADVLRIESGFVRDRADDVAGLDAVIVTDFDAERFEAGFPLAARRLVRMRSFFVVHAKAGTQRLRQPEHRPWIPAFAGTTKLGDAIGKHELDGFLPVTPHALNLELRSDRQVAQFRAPRDERFPIRRRAVDRDDAIVRRKPGLRGCAVRRNVGNDERILVRQQEESASFHWLEVYSSCICNFPFCQVYFP